jgi:hypothetical protein
MRLSFLSIDCTLPDSVTIIKLHFTHTLNMLIVISHRHNLLIGLKKYVITNK